MHFPEDLLYTNDHEWVRIEGTLATIGITDYAQDQLGDIVYVDIESLDSEVEEHDMFGAVEAVKTVSDLFSPVAGTVIEVNEALGKKPEIVNSDPYGKGWMVKIRMVEGYSPNGLMNAFDYKKAIGQEA